MQDMRDGPHSKIIKKTRLKIEGEVISLNIQGAQEKLYFFHNSLQPLPRLHRFKRPSKLSTNFFLFYQLQPSAGEGEVAIFREFFEKKQYVMNSLYVTQNSLFTLKIV